MLYKNTNYLISRKKNSKTIEKFRMEHMSMMNVCIRTHFSKLELVTIDGHKIAKLTELVGQ